MTQERRKGSKKRKNREPKVKLPKIIHVEKSAELDKKGIVICSDCRQEISTCICDKTVQI